MRDIFCTISKYTNDFEIWWILSINKGNFLNFNNFIYNLSKQKCIKENEKMISVIKSTEWLRVVITALAISSTAVTTTAPTIPPPITATALAVAKTSTAIASAAATTSTSAETASAAAVTSATATTSTVTASTAAMAPTASELQDGYLLTKKSMVFANLR